MVNKSAANLPLATVRYSLPNRRVHLLCVGLSSLGTLAVFILPFSSSPAECMARSGRWRD